MLFPDNSLVGFHDNLVELEKILKKNGDVISIFDGTQYDEELQHGFLTRFQSSKSAGICYDEIMNFMEQIISEK